jgi:hypothetical protein
VPLDLSAPGLIPTVVRYGISNGQLCQGKIKGSTGHESLWLNIPASSPAKEQAEPKPETKSERIGEGNQQSQVGVTQPEPKVRTAPTYTRCNQMIKCLEKRSIYCQKRIRDIFLDLVKAIVDEKNHLTLARIHQELIDRAEKIGQEKDLGVDHRQWEAAASRMIKPYSTHRRIRSFEPILLRWPPLYMHLRKDSVTRLKPILCCVW